MAFHWIKAAIKHPGALRAQAKRAGESTAAFASDVLAPGSHASARTQRRARLAKTLAKFRKH